MKLRFIAFVSLATLAGFAHAAAAPAPGAAPTAPAVLKIGVVNFDALRQQGPQAQAARAAFEAEFAPVEREIIAQRQALVARQEKLQKDAATMTNAQLTLAQTELDNAAIDQQARETKAKELMNRREAEEENKVARVVIEEVQKYARANGYSIVLAGGILYVSEGIDITAPVLQALQARTPAPAAAAPATPAKP